LFHHPRFDWAYLTLISAPRILALWKPKDMAIPHTVPAALGALAFFPTTAIMGIHIILARSSVDRAPSVRTTAIVATVFEAVIFVAIPFLSLSHIAPWAPSARLKGVRTIWFSAGLPVCAVATAVSVSNVVCFSRVVDDHSSTIMGWMAGDFLVGASVALGLAFATQLLFFVFHLIAGRALGAHPQVSTQIDQERKLRPRIKTVPYHETARTSRKDCRSLSFDCPTPPGSSGGPSAASSIRSSLSQAIRPISSRTRLLSVKGRASRRPVSLDLPGSNKRRSRFIEEGFDSWDTSAVDPENRQTVLESSSPPLTRFLETIPASPTPSRSPSPGRPLDLLEPPAPLPRSRSYSSISAKTIQAQRAAFTEQASESEAHIHPLFRSDSPTPPPSVTPGTVVVAAPNSGQLISDRQSIRSKHSVRRLRSESLPPVPSPLSRSASCESLALQNRKTGTSSPASGICEEDETAVPVPVPVEAEAGSSEGERKMTPPIPDWILSAGQRTSLAGYNDRKSQVPEDGEDVEGGKEASP
jgi:hypothetical protein